MINYVGQIYLVTYDPDNDTDSGIRAFTNLEAAEKFAAAITKENGIADVDSVDVSKGRRAQYFSSFSGGKKVESGYN